MRAAALLVSLAVLCCADLPSAQAQPTEPAGGEAAAPTEPTRGDGSQPSEQQEAEGRQLAKDGFAAYKANDFATAAEKFEQARKVYPTGQVLRMAGYSLLALEKWLEAADALEQALAATYKPLEEGDRQQTQDQLDKALANLGVVSLKSSVAGATASVDGKAPVPLPAEIRLTPGSHRVVVSAEGHTDAEQTVEIGAAERAEVVLDPAVEAAAPPPPPPPPPPPEPEPPGEAWFPHQRLIGGIVGGTGLAVTVAGVATLISGSSLRSATQDNVDAHNAAYGEDCSRADYNLCYADAMLINEDGARAQSLETAGLVLTIGGGTLLAVGAVFFFAAPWDDEPTEEQPAASPKAAQSDEQARLACGPYGLLGVGCTGAF